MKKRMVLILLIVTFIVTVGHSQNYTLRIDIENQPSNEILLGSIRGDNFTVSDTIRAEQSSITPGGLKTFSATFSQDAPKGMYRLVFGQTTYARVMNEPPQQLDFIFNGENIRFSTGFETPVDSLKILNSEENRVWFSFSGREKEYQKKLMELEKEVDFYQAKIAELSAAAGEEEKTRNENNAARLANDFNQLQMERERYINQVVSDNSHLFAARMINACREPFRDGYLNEKERNLSFRQQYLKYIDFSDESLINSHVLSDKIFNYLVTFNQRDFTQVQREEAYIRAVDAIMQKVKEDTGQDSKMYKFVLSYLAEGFEGLKMDKVLKWISEHYAGSL